jgi:enoyl-CoA hydratase/carnithine racemase
MIATDWRSPASVLSEPMRIDTRGRARSSNCLSVNLALVSEFGSSYLLPLRFGYTRAAELILLGKPFDALRAAELGLVTQVVPDQNLLSTATETARILAAKSAAAVQATKRLMKRALREQLEQALKLESEVFTERVRSDDAKRAFQAFFVKRQPVTMQ